MRDESRVITNALLSYGSRAIAGVVGILMVPYLIGQLGEERYGTIGLATSLLTLVLLVELGIRPAASRQFSRFLYSGESRRANELASTSLAIYAGLALLVVVVMSGAARPFLAAMQLPAELVPETRWVLVAIAVALGVSLLQAPFEAALASQLRYDVTQYCQALGAVFRAAFIVALFSTLEPALIVWAAAALVWALISLAVHGAQAHRHCPSLELRRRLVSRRGVRDLAGIGAYAAVIRAAQWGVEHSGPLIISAWLGPQAVASYTPAIVLVLSLQPLSQAFLGQLTPVVTRAHTEGDPERIRRVLTRSTRYSLLIGGGSVVWVGVVASSLVPVWLGESFAITAWVLVAWCALSLLQSGVGASFAVFLGTGRLRAVAWINVVLAAAGVGGGIWLVTRTELGVLAPAVAMLAAQTLRSVAWFVLATRISGQARLPYLRDAFAGPAVCLTALALAALWLQDLAGPDPLRALVVAALGAGLLYAPLVWTVGLNAEDRAKALEYAASGWRHARGVLSRADP